MFNQANFDIRCEWGLHGVGQLAPISDVIIIVDVLSFSTCVEIATNRGALIYPYRTRDASAKAFATLMKAELAEKDRSAGVFSLSPESLLDIPEGTRLVLPSPNGATLSLATGDTPTLIGCFRNYQAVAEVAERYGPRIAVIPAGERWPDSSLRPSLEDWLCAGAIIGQLTGNRSPEAYAAMVAFRAAELYLSAIIYQIGSGQELIERGFASDISLAAALNSSQCVPVLRDRAYIKHPS